MLTDNQIRALRAPFPPESLKPDMSRGFELTSIKAAYVIERLNDVFGLCGVGWITTATACGPSLSTPSVAIAWVKAPSRIPMLASQP